MSDARSFPAPSLPDAPRARSLIGPLISADRPVLRYAAALAVVLLIAALRAALAPLLGTQAPLLPFVLVVIASAYLGGRGPALLASALTPALATLWFTNWPHDAPALQWMAHVAFFLVVAIVATVIMHELQTSVRGQQQAMDAAALHAHNAEQSAAQLRLIADALPALISYVDRDRVYRFTNQTYETWLGKPCSQVVGRHVSDVLGSVAYELLRPKIDKVLEGERVSFESEIPYGAGLRSVAAHYVPDVDVTGMVRGYYALVEDISERRRVEKALRDADRRKDEFLAMLAHELRNPLAPIRNVSHILANGALDEELVHRSSALLQRQVTQLTRLVDDLLDVARITRGSVVLQRELVDVETAVRTALESVQPMIAARHQTVSVEGPPEAASVDGDPVRLCQVVSNLLGNATKYSPERAHIFVSMRTVAELVEISVRDEGIGLDAQMLPHVFDLFEQGDRSLDRSQGGLGIGLTIVKRLVEMHGGSVEVRSAGLQRGSEFRVRLPRARAPLTAPTDANSPAGNTERQRRILIVDDNVDAADSMCWLLKAEGHQVEVVYDGASALSVLEDFRADVVLLDIGLPRMDGYMVAHAVRARFTQLRPRLVALTGYGRIEDRNAALAAGFDVHLAKPVEPRRLLDVVAADASSATRDIPG